MSLHAGEVRYDQHGVTGMAVNLAFRLLEAAPLKQALASSPGVLAVITSSWFYAEVARQTPVAGEYHCVDVAVKETRTIGWICLPDRALAIERRKLSSDEGAAGRPQEFDGAAAACNMVVRVNRNWSRSRWLSANAARRSASG